MGLENRFTENSSWTFTPNKGEIILCILSMTEDEHRILRREIGMVFQGSALFDSMSVIENVLFPMRMLTKLSESEMIDRAETVIERVNLIDAKQKLPNEISGGMQKRVAIARAVVMRPKYLLRRTKLWARSKNSYRY